LQEHFSPDVEATFAEELLHFVGYIKQFSSEACSPLASLKHIPSDGISETFPNVDIVLRMYLTLPQANTAGEWSFSVLKRVKNQLRSTVGQDKLCDLSLLTIESDLTKEIDFQDIIANFATTKNKSRKRVM
jgi:hypothetical protein